MDSLIEIHADGEWRPAATLTVTPDRVMFDYLLDYAFSESTWRVALGLPVDLTLRTAPTNATQTPLAFLWDLVPQGRGRQYLEGMLGYPANDPSRDLALAQHGAFAPIGRLRLNTAVSFYERNTVDQVVSGFTRMDMRQRTDNFLEQLAMHSMLAAGTPGVQGVAPKYLLTQDEEGSWYPDVALEDRLAHKHWLVKLPRGRDEVDRRVLRHEAIYLRVAAACGLTTITAPEFEDDMLFLERFDRQVAHGKVVRIHQETLAALTGTPGFGIGASLFDVTEKLAEVATEPGKVVGEFLCREVFNRALRNPDNHLRNTSVQELPDGKIQLTPLYDVSPMYLDPEGIARTCVWRLPDGRIADEWDVILGQLRLNEAVKEQAAEILKEFGENKLPLLPALLAEHDADAQVIEACRQTTQQEFNKLLELTVRAQPRP